jgi:hypothetical protein
MAKRQSFPGPMAIQAHSMRAENKYVPAPFLPHLASWERAPLTEDGLIFDHLPGDPAPALMKLRAFQRVIAAMVKQTPPLLPGEVDIDFLVAIGAQREPLLNRYERLFLLRWRGHRFPPNRPLRLHVEVNSDR